MDTGLILTILIALVAVIFLFILGIFVLEIFSARKDRKTAAGQTADTASSPAPQSPIPFAFLPFETADGQIYYAKEPIAVGTPSTESPIAEAAPVIEEPVLADETPAEDVGEGTREDGIWIAAPVVETLEEKYLALSTEAKNWYDEIVRYAMLQKGVKRFKTAKQEVYKVGKHRIVKLSIRRGVIISEFLILNLSLPTGDGVSLKQAPTILKVDSDDALTVAIRTIDLAIAAAEEDRRIKREQKNERRRQARAAEAAE